MAEVTMLPGTINGWDGRYKACRYCGSRRFPEVIDGICTECYEDEFGKLGLNRALAEREYREYSRGQYAPTQEEDSAVERSMELPVVPLSAAPPSGVVPTNPAIEVEEPWKQALAEIAPTLPEGDEPPTVPASAPERGNADLFGMFGVAAPTDAAPTTAPAEPWHKLYDQCLNCGTTDSPQYQRGVCKTCYVNWNAASFNDKPFFRLAPPMNRHLMAEAVEGKALAVAADPAFRVTESEQVMTLVERARGAAQARFTARIAEQRAAESGEVVPMAEQSKPAAVVADETIPASEAEVLPPKPIMVAAPLVVDTLPLGDLIGEIKRRRDAMETEATELRERLALKEREIEEFVGMVRMLA